MKTFCWGACSQGKTILYKWTNYKSMKYNRLQNLHCTADRWTNIASDKCRQLVNATCKYDFFRFLSTFLLLTSPFSFLKWLCFQLNPASQFWPNHTRPYQTIKNLAISTLISQFYKHVTILQKIRQIQNSQLLPNFILYDDTFEQSSAVINKCGQFKSWWKLRLAINCL